MAQKSIYIDGGFYPPEEAKISVFDHGLLYGDGVFEGIRVYRGKIFLCEEHLDRLYEGAHTFCIRIPLSREEMTAAMEETLSRNGIEDGYIRLLVTRGVGDLGLNPFKCERPSVVIIADTIQLYPEEVYRNGMAIVTAATPAVHHEAINPRVKSLNYLNNILAKIEALNAGVEEAIMLNGQGYVAECTGDNIFMVDGGRVLTPSVTSGLLVGCTRNAVLRLAREAGHEVIETELQRFDLYNADECFLTGTAAEIVPVVKIDGRVVGTGEPGPVTTDLLTRFRRFIESY